MEDSLKMSKQTVEIDGGRKLYNYTFEEEQDHVAMEHVEAKEEPTITEGSR
jgi:hypothetical protein